MGRGGKEDRLVPQAAGMPPAYLRHITGPHITPLTSTATSLPRQVPVHVLCMWVCTHAGSFERAAKGLRLAAGVAAWWCECTQKSALSAQKTTHGC